MNLTQVIDITAQFKVKWGRFVNPKLSILQICQTSEDVFLKYAIVESESESIVSEEKIDFIISNDGLILHPRNLININAAEFLKLDSTDIINCFNYLFDEEMIDFIIDYTSQGIRDDQILFDDNPNLNT